MSTLVGYADHAAGIVGGTGAGIVLAGGGDRIHITDWNRPAGIIVAVAGRDGTSIEIRGSVPTYADLPDDLTADDRGALYIVQADDLGYAWDGYSFPPNGAGVAIRGPQGAPGRGVSSISVTSSDELRFKYTDGASTDVVVPAVAAAGDARDQAVAARDAAKGYRDTAKAHRDDAEGFAQDTEQDAAATAADRVATGEDRTQTGLDRTQAGQDAADAAQAKTDAETAATDAKGYRDTAEGHMVAAGGYAQDADAAAGAADGYRTDAQGHAATATTAASDAETYRDQAETFRDEAEQAAADAAQGAPAGGWKKTELHADVQDSLDLADSATQPGHTHPISRINGLDDALAGKSDTGHTHTTADVAGLQSVIDQAVADLVAGAPGALDTLAELAAALGNDPNFATTVSDQIGERAKTTDVQTWLADKSDVGHTHTATDITDATSTGRGVLTGSASAGRDALSVPSKTEMRARPAFHVWDGSGTWSPPDDVGPNDVVWNTDTNEVHSVEDI